MSHIDNLLKDEMSAYIGAPTPGEFSDRRKWIDSIWQTHGDEIKLRLDEIKRQLRDAAVDELLNDEPSRTSILNQMLEERAKRLLDADDAGSAEIGEANMAAYAALESAYDADEGAKAAVWTAFDKVIDGLRSG